MTFADCSPTSYSLISARAVTVHHSMAAIRHVDVYKHHPAADNLELEARFCLRNNLDKTMSPSKNACRYQSYGQRQILSSPGCTLVSNQHPYD